MGCLTGVCAAWADVGQWNKRAGEIALVPAYGNVLLRCRDRAGWDWLGTKPTTAAAGAAARVLS